jgi:Type VI secretion system/phage-baseplate injector OB domain
MSSDTRDDLIRKELLKLITSASDCLKVAKVLSVDKAKQTCKVKLVSDDNEITARLRAVENGEDKGSWYVPKVGSTVVVGRMAQFKRHIVLMFSEIDEMYTTSNKIDINCNDVKFNNGTFGGLVKAEALTQKLNKLEQDLTTLKAAFGAWVVVASDGGAALKVATSTWAGQAISQTAKADLENTKIKH